MAIVGKWKLNEASGNRADISGNSNNLTVVGAVTQVRGHKGLNLTAAGSFGSGKYLKITDASQTGLDLTPPFTISAWVKFTAIGGGGLYTIVSKWGNNSSNNLAYNFSINDDGAGTAVLDFRVSANGTSATVVNGTTNLSNNTWYHVIAIADGTDLRVYLNGTLDCTPVSFTSSVYNGIGEFRIGANHTVNTYPLTGSIDDVVVASHAFTATERTDHAAYRDDFRPSGWTKELCAIGDSICWGNEDGGPPGHSVTLRMNTLAGWTYDNMGVSAQTSTQIKNRFQTDAVNKNTCYVFFIGATNDSYYNPPISISTTLANLDSMLGMCQAASPAREFVVGEIPPITDRTTPPSGWTKEQFQEWAKKLNAAFRKWCIQNSVRLAPVYQQLAHASSGATEDDLNPSMATDNVHPNDAGYDKMGDVYDIAVLVPSRKYQWGVAAFLTDDEGWGWWLKNGTSSVTGDADTGTLNLPQNQNADSDVKCIEEYTKTITITPTVTAGTVIIKYRTNGSNFTRDAGSPAWQTYSAPFDASDQFIQIRLEGSSASTATVTDVNMTWTAGQQPPAPTESDRMALRGANRGILRGAA